MATAEGTAVVSIEPREDQIVVKLAEEAVQVLKYAQLLMVVTPEDIHRATEDLGLIAGIKNQLETKRKEFVKPLDEHRKSIQEKFKTITGPVDEADKLLRDKIIAFNTEQRRLQEAAAEAQRLIDEAKVIQQGITQQTGEVFEQPADVVTPDAAPVQTVYTGTGSMNTRMIRKWEVIDIAAVPAEYLMVDASKIGKVVRAGIPSIPGIRIYEEESLQITPIQKGRRAIEEGSGAEEAKDGDLPF